MLYRNFTLNRFTKKAIYGHDVIDFFFFDNFYIRVLISCEKMFKMHCRENRDLFLYSSYIPIVYVYVFRRIYKIP